MFQPLYLLTLSIATVPYCLSRPWTIEYLPVTPKRPVRVAVYKTPGPGGRGRALRPLHIELHAGAFMGGMPECHAPFDSRVARETGAVVVSLSYRLAPEHVFPAAIDDVDATIAWIRENAAERWQADPELMTISGFSAGGCLAMAATQQPAPGSTAFKAIVTFYGPVDLRLPPGEKPKGPGFPEKDPTEVLLPLYDAYAGPKRAQHMEDPRMNPTLAARETLPERILLVVPGIDILVAELHEFARRVNEEDERDCLPGRVELMYEEKCFHGYLEVPDGAMKGLKEMKDRAFTRGVEYLKETYRLHGWTWEG
ncbi:Alpha/Beta hydrolase protein [Stachybotrys elegans]|uniref:Alpha/Beta hydrolase protein n=1 Tax=Stachybotrys elegans TaxID=80388 RepID=A0A8K0SV85_9HYPO|nr:Alpha/Beta hydrolase protein [Stachybotrys elegans]